MSAGVATRSAAATRAGPDSPRQHRPSHDRSQGTTRPQRRRHRQRTPGQHPTPRPRGQQENTRATATKRQPPRKPPRQPPTLRHRPNSKRTSQQRQRRTSSTPATAALAPDQPARAGTQRPAATNPALLGEPCPFRGRAPKPHRSELSPSSLAGKPPTPRPVPPAKRPKTRFPERPD